MHKKKKLVLDNIMIRSFVTALCEDPLSKIRGGLSQAACPASEEEGCTDSNRCGSGCNIAEI